MYSKLITISGKVWVFISRASHTQSEFSFRHIILEYFRLSSTYVFETLWNPTLFSQYNLYKSLSLKLNIIIKLVGIYGKNFLPFLPSVSNLYSTCGPHHNTFLIGDMFFYSFIYWGHERESPWLLKWNCSHKLHHKFFMSTSFKYEELIS